MEGGTGIDDVDTAEGGREEGTPSLRHAAHCIRSFSLILQPRAAPRGRHSVRRFSSSSFLVRQGVVPQCLSVGGPLSFSARVMKTAFMTAA